MAALLTTACDDRVEVEQSFAMMLAEQTDSFRSDDLDRFVQTIGRSAVLDVSGIPRAHNQVDAMRVLRALRGATSGQYDATTREIAVYSEVAIAWGDLDLGMLHDGSAPAQGFYVVIGERGERGDWETWQLMTNPDLHVPDGLSWLARLSRAGLIVCSLIMTAESALANSQTSAWRELGGTESSLTEAKFGKWMTVLREESESRRQRHQSCGTNAASDCGPAFLNRLVRSLRGRGLGAQVDQVNRVINQLPYRSDSATWGRNDHWAVPEAFLAKGGDCEDFAIAKYFVLRDLGFAAEDLRVLVLRNTRDRIDHAVLVVHLDGRDMVLDVVRDAIVPWSAVGHYRPLYSLNETTAWLHL